jgi:hypothetical protein
LKILADEHVAPAIVALVRDYAISDGFELSDVRDQGLRGAKDVPLVAAFAATGGKGLISADKGFYKRHQQMLAVRDANLRVAVLPEQWQNAKRHQQAAHILWWWPKIEETLSTCPDRSFWKVPWEFPHRTEKMLLRQEMVDFTRAAQKAKKAARR